MEIEKILAPLGEEMVNSLKTSLSKNDLENWLFRKRPSLDDHSPYEFLSSPTSKKIESIKKVVRCLILVKKD